jgi:hypothetical protein
MAKTHMGALLLVLVGCSDAARFPDRGSPGKGGAGGGGASQMDAAISVPDAPFIGIGNDGSISVNPGDGAAADSCTDAARDFVYVLGISATSFATSLYKFAPDKRTFTAVGDLRCPGNGDVNSMAVDRKGIAWVNWGGQILRVNTSDATCTSDPPIDLPAGWSQIGMGFSIDRAGSEAETLFISNHSNALSPMTSALAKIDASGTLTMVSPFSGGTFTNMNAELTGTGDARLYAFFITPANTDPNVDPLFGLAEKATAAVSRSVTITGLSVTTAGTKGCTNGGGCINSWAFSFWGGRFYFYTGHGTPSTVTEYDPFVEGGSGITLNYATAPIEIVGAGVSTCAPTKPPIVR